MYKIFSSSYSITAVKFRNRLQDLFTSNQWGIVDYLAAKNDTIMFYQLHTAYSISFK